MAINRIGLCFGVGDDIQLLGMGQELRDESGFQQIIEPIPASIGFYDGSVIGVQSGEIVEDQRRSIRDALLFYDPAGVINGRDIAIVPLQIDA